MMFGEYTLELISRSMSLDIGIIFQLYKGIFYIDYKRNFRYFWINKKNNCQYNFLNKCT